MEWRPIETAPQDGSEVIVYASAVQDLQSFICQCAWHPDAGYCVDELRQVTHWIPMPEFSDNK